MIRLKKNIEYISSNIFNPFKILFILLNRANHFLASKNLKNSPQVAIYSFDHIGLNINLYGIYEKDNLKIIFDYLLTKFGNTVMLNSCALDIGANIGNHSLYFSKFFKNVYAFEPNPKTYDLLFLNSKLEKNIKAFNFGLGQFNNVVKFKTSSQNIGASKVVDGFNNVLSDDEIFVNIIRLDDVHEILHESISLIKLDVEGQELNVIKGAINIINKYSPIILFEQHANDFVNGKSAVIKELESLGYHFIIIEDKFYFNKIIFGKYLSFIFGSIFGFQKILHRVNSFDNKFYELIIAIPDKFPKDF